MTRESMVIRVASLFHVPKHRAVEMLQKLEDGYPLRINNGFQTYMVRMTGRELRIEL